MYGQDAANPRESWRSILSWGARWNRKEYWVFVGTALLLSGLLDHLFHIRLAAGLTGLLIAAQIRRVHDFGCSGWWAALVIGAPGLAGVVIGVLNGVSAHLAAQPLIIAVCALTTLADVIVVGAIPGDAGPNRFGPPPGRQALAEVFR